MHRVFLHVRGVQPNLLVKFIVPGVLLRPPYTAINVQAGYGRVMPADLIAGDRPADAQQVMGEVNLSRVCRFEVAGVTHGFQHKCDW